MNVPCTSPRAEHLQKRAAGLRDLIERQQKAILESSGPAYLTADLKCKLRQYQKSLRECQASINALASVPAQNPVALMGHMLSKPNA